MAEVAFYHLQKSPLETVLPKLLEKTLAAGKRAAVLGGSAERVEALNVALWTYRQDSWLPHGSAKDGHASEQPVWLTHGDDVPNGATYLFLVDGATSAHVEGAERCFDLFDGNDAQAVAAARRRWSGYKAAGHTLTYWQQTDRGGWAEKKT